MANVVSLQGYRPSPRYDGVKWTRARIEEAGAQAGPFTAIETIPLGDYPDATHPPLLNFTSDQATLAEGFYRVAFLDEGDAEQLSGVVFSSGQVPTGADIREWSQLDFDSYGWEIEEDGTDPLDRLVGWVSAWIATVTGLAFTSELSPDIAAVYEMAVLQLVQWIVIRQSPDFIEDYADFDLIKSFTAGDYSEERRSLAEASSMLHPYGPINDLLEILAGEGGGGSGADNSPAVYRADTDWGDQLETVLDQPYAHTEGRPYGWGWRPMTWG